MKTEKYVELVPERILWEIYNLGIRNGHQGRNENEFARLPIEKALEKLQAIYDEDEKVAQAHQEMETFCAMKKKYKLDQKKIAKVLSGCYSGLNETFAEVYCEKDKRTPNFNKLSEKIIEGDIYES